MTSDLIAAMEYETFAFARHLSPGRTRRTRGVLDQSAYTLLTLLQAGGPASIGELSAITGLDASTLNRQTAALLRADHAERIADPDGGLARKFRITARGGNVLAEERAASREVLAEMTEDWPPADVETLTALLGRLNHGIEERSGRIWPRPSPH